MTYPEDPTSSAEEPGGNDEELDGMDEGLGGMEEELGGIDEGLGGNNVGADLAVAPGDESDVGASLKQNRAHGDMPSSRNDSGGGISTPFPSPFGSGNDLPRLRPPSDPLDPLVPNVMARNQSRRKADANVGNGCHSLTSSPF